VGFSVLAEASIIKWDEFGWKIAEKVEWPKESDTQETRATVRYDPVLVASIVCGRT
jgi:hypothetical protein